MRLAEECAALLEHATEAQRAVFAAVESAVAEAPGDRALTVENCDHRERDVRDWLQAKIDAEDKKIRALEEKNREGDADLSLAISRGDPGSGRQRGSGRRISRHAEAPAGRRFAELRTALQEPAE